MPRERRTSPLTLKRTLLAALAVAAILALATTFRAQPQGVTYDLVIANGRVMDPESGLDGVRNVGISDGKIAAISDETLQGKERIDATGLVVAPGFIDLHEHGQEPRNYQFQAHDGVTTSLELEVGTADVDAWYAQREGKSLINFGVSIGHIPVRMKVIEGSWEIFAKRPMARTNLPRQSNSRDAHRKWNTACSAEHSPSAWASTTPKLPRTKKFWKYFASRRTIMRPCTCMCATSASGAAKRAGCLEEVIAAAASAGAPLHVVHITSVGLRDTPQLLRWSKERATGTGRHHRVLSVSCFEHGLGIGAL